MNALIEALDRACPGYVPDDLSEDLAYPWIGGFVRHVIGRHVAGDTVAVRAAFDVIEREIAVDSPHAELAVIGFLEDMQNGNLHGAGTRPADFRVYLGRHSLKAWKELNSFWGTNE